MRSGGTTFEGFRNDTRLATGRSKVEFIIVLTETLVGEYQC